jgi:hypothetical protein
VNAKPLHLAGVEDGFGGQDGCCPRCLLPDKQASLLFLFVTVIKLGESGWYRANDGPQTSALQAAQDLYLPNDSLQKMVWSVGLAPTITCSQGKRVGYYTTTR